MIERTYILDNVDPVAFYGVNNVNMQLLKTLCLLYTSDAADEL